MSVSNRPQHQQARTPKAIQRDIELRCERCHARFAPGTLNEKAHCKMCSLEVRVGELEMAVVKMGGKGSREQR
jgi:hypothetical protein